METRKCKKCNNEFSNQNSDYCSPECTKESFQVKILESKTMHQLLQEENEKLLSEINEKVKKKKKHMNPAEPETGFYNSSKK